MNLRRKHYRNSYFICSESATASKETLRALPPPFYPLETGPKIGWCTLSPLSLSLERMQVDPQTRYFMLQKPFVLGQHASHSPLFTYTRQALYTPRPSLRTPSLYPLWQLFLYKPGFNGAFMVISICATTQCGSLPSIRGKRERVFEKNVNSIDWFCFSIIVKVIKIPYETLE